MTSKTSQFERKKTTILKELSKPDYAYSDLSPKGAIDEGIRDLIDDINSYQGLVTTSSCSGRVSVFLEGNKAGSNLPECERACEDEVEDKREPPLSGSTSDPLSSQDGKVSNIASNGGKGGGGRWLFVSHEPLAIESGRDEAGLLQRFGLRAASGAELHVQPAMQRLVHFKFEPMIIHVLAASRKEANAILAAAHEAGFRESGAASIPVAITSNNNSAATSPISVAVRTTGLAFDNIVGAAPAPANLASGTEPHICDAVVSETYLGMLVGIANEKFAINAARTQRFGELLRARMVGPTDDWEDAAVRRERKKREGLEARERDRARRLDGARASGVGVNGDGFGLDAILG